MKILISTGGGDPANYVQAVRRAGGEAVAAYLPPLEPRYDGLILAGGGDMEPALGIGGNWPCWMCLWRRVSRCWASAGVIRW